MATYTNWEAVSRVLDASPSIHGKQGVVSASHTLLVLLFIAKHLNRETGTTWLSHATIAEEARTGPATVKRAIAALCATKHLVVTPGNGGDAVRRANTYAFGPAMGQPVVVVKTQTTAPATPPRRQTTQPPLQQQPTRPPVKYANFLDEFRAQRAQQTQGAAQ